MTLLTSAEIKTRIAAFIAESFVSGRGGGAPADDDSLTSVGVLDSVGVLSLITFLEEAFGITIADEEVVPDNLDSIARLDAFVRRKTAA